MIAVLACKLCRALIRLLGRGGTDFPGRVALKLCPNLLGELAKNVTTVIVTGTNGKTTTSRMIEQSWQDAGISYFANKSGANLLSGVTAEFAVHSTLTGRCKYPYALIEADEAALKFISKYVDAKVIVFTNVFRDQLDRYGEVMHTLLSNIVSNPISAIMNGNYIGILMWGCLFGVAMKKLGADSTKVFLSNTADAVSTIVRWIINLAPFGIMGLVFTNVVSNGLAIFTQYGKLLLLLVGTMRFRTGKCHASAAVPGGYSLMSAPEAAISRYSHSFSAG